MIGRGQAYLLLFFFIFTFVAFVLHHGALDSPMYYDSAYLQENEHVFATEGLAGVIGLFPQRPVTMTTFYLNYLAAGLNPYWLRLLNVVFLGAAASALSLVAILLLGVSEAGGRLSQTNQRLIAFFLGLIFAAHPLQTFVVVYIWQRGALLCSLFSLAALAAYLGTRTGRLGSPRAGYGLCFVLFGLAMLSKENAVALPAVLILAELAFFKETWRDLVTRGSIFVAAAVAVIALLTLLERPHGLAERSSGILHTLATYYRESGLDWSQVLVNQCKSLFSYIALVLFPRPSSLQLITPTVVSYSLLESPLTLAAVVGAGALLVAGCVLVRARPLTGFGILFFILNLIPESILVPQYLLVSYRAVLPMVGLLLVLGDAIGFLCGKSVSLQSSRTVQACIWVGLAFVVGLLGSVTLSKANLWTDPVRFWNGVVAQVPPLDERVERYGASHALNSLGVSLQKSGKPADAIAYHRKVLELVPHSTLAQLSLGNAYSLLGDLEGAEMAFREALEAHPDLAAAHEGLADVLVRKNASLAEAETHFRKAVERAPKNPYLQHRLGVFLLQQGKPDQAIACLRRAAALNANSAEARYTLGKALSRAGKIEEARRVFLETLKIDPNYWPAHNDLGVILARSGDLKGAIGHFLEVLRIQPGHGPARANLDAARRELAGRSSK